LLNLGGLKIFPCLKLALDLSLPPHLNLIAEKNKSNPDIILNFIPFELKETWYGKNTMEGFFCSLLPVNARDKAVGEIVEADNTAGLAVHCRLQIRNQTKTVLELDKIPFYSAGLAIYEKNGILISDSPVIDALENDFRMAAVSAKSESHSLLVHGKKQEPWRIHQGTQIIKNIAGL
jgi:hypothetical protein